MKHLYVLGDSISMDYGPHLEECLRGFMTYSRKAGDDEARLNLDVPQGANGGDSSMVLAFLKAKARAGGIPADILLLNCGLHDIKTDPATGRKQVPLEQYRANLLDIVAQVRVMGPQLVWARTTPCDEKIHNHAKMAFHRFAADGIAYNETADRVMTEASVPIIDLYTFTRNLGPDLYRDHVHLHPPICRKQGAFIAGWLVQHIREC